MHQVLRGSVSYANWRLDLNDCSFNQQSGAKEVRNIFKDYDTSSIATMALSSGSSDCASWMTINIKWFIVMSLMTKHWSLLRVMQVTGTATRRKETLWKQHGICQPYWGLKNNKWRCMHLGVETNWIKLNSVVYEFEFGSFCTIWIRIQIWFK